MKNVPQPLAKSVLIILGLTAAAADAGICSKILASRTITLIISNEEIDHIMKKVKSLQGPGLLIK